MYRREDDYVFSSPSSSLFHLDVFSVSVSVNSCLLVDCCDFLIVVIFSFLLYFHRLCPLLFASSSTLSSLSTFDSILFVMHFVYVVDFVFVFLIFVVFGSISSSSHFCCLFVLRWIVVIPRFFVVIFLVVVVSFLGL